MHACHMICHLHAHTCKFHSTPLGKSRRNLLLIFHSDPTVQWQGRRRAERRRIRLGRARPSLAFPWRHHPDSTRGQVRVSRIMINTFALTHTGKTCINPAECPSDITSAEGQAATMSVVSFATSCSTSCSTATVFSTL